jgi:hypothetical protein
VVRVVQLLWGVLEAWALELLFMVLVEQEVQEEREEQDMQEDWLVTLRELLLVLIQKHH